MEWEFMYKMGIAGEEVIDRALALTPHNHIDIFCGDWLSSTPFSGISYYIYTILHIYVCFKILMTG